MDLVHVRRVMERGTGDAGLGCDREPAGRTGGLIPGGHGRRNPWFQIIKYHGRFVTNRSQRAYHVPVDGLVKLTNMVPRRALPAVPSWVKELTWQPTATH